MQQTTMAHVYLCNKPASSAHVPQNLKYNKINEQINNFLKAGGEANDLNSHFYNDQKHMKI